MTRAWTRTGPRYRSIGQVAEGSFGSVHRAVDTVTGARVALKQFHHNISPESVRAEVLALRGLDLPQVARLEDFQLGPGGWLVTQWVDGEPFPGGAGQAGLTRLARRLLATLHRVHDFGVLHLDLKPANVLVDTDGWPWLLDFGLADGVAVRGHPRPVIRQTTLAYLAPEARPRRRIDHRADLYAVGVMLYEAITGALPEGDVDENRRQAIRRKVAAPSLAERHPDWPLASLVDALLATSPADRPASAAAAAAMLRPSSPQPSLLLGEERLTRSRSALEALVEERVASGRDRAELLAEWEDAGFLRRDGRTLVVDPASVRRLPRLDLRHAIPPGLASAVDGALEEAARICAERGFADAFDTLRTALLTVRLAEVTPETLAGERELLMAAAALAGSKPVAEELRQVERELWVGQERGVADLDGALRAVAMLLGERPYAVAGLPPTLITPVLSARLRQTTLAAKGAPTQVEAALAEALAALPPGNDRLAALWRSQVAYHLGRYPEAAGHARTALDLARDPPDAAGLAVNLAAIEVETGDLSAAKAHAEAALPWARSVRSPVVAARAESVLRQVAYRLAEDHPPDTELVRSAVAHTPPVVAAFIALTEAAFAWRRDDPLGPSLADEARSRFAAGGFAAGRALAAALGAYLRGKPMAEALPDNLPEGIRWQAHALREASHRRHVTPPDLPAGRLEVLCPSDIRTLVSQIGRVNP